MNFSKDAIAVHLDNHKYPYILLLLIILLNLPLWSGLIYDWLHDGNYSHGFLIVPISIYLFYRHKNDLALPAQPSRTGALIFVAGCLGSILAASAGELFTSRLSALIIITGISLFYLGKENFKISKGDRIAQLIIQPVCTFVTKGLMEREVFSLIMTLCLSFIYRILCSESFVEMVSPLA